MMYGYGFEQMGGWGLLGGGMMFFFWIITFLFMLLTVKSFSTGKETERKDKAIDILKERYAKGEINKEEFEAKKKDLTG